MPHADLLGDLVHDGDWRGFDLSYGRIARVVDHLRGAYLGGPDTVIHSPGNVQRPRLQAHNPDLARRLWYDDGSLRSVNWAAANGLSLLSGNIVTGEGTDDFTTAQLNLLAEYRRTLSTKDADLPARVAPGRVIVPFDSADAAGRARYRAYAASRHERTLAPRGPKRTLFAPDMVGTAEQILEQLAADPVVAEVSELRLELPYEFHGEEYEQILHDTRHPDRTGAGLAPRLSDDIPQLIRGPTRIVQTWTPLLHPAFWSSGLIRIGCPAGGIPSRQPRRSRRDWPGSPNTGWGWRPASSAWTDVTTWKRSSRVRCGPTHGSASPSEGPAALGRTGRTPRTDHQPDSTPRTRRSHRVQQHAGHHLRGRCPLDRVTGELRGFHQFRPGRPKSRS